MALRSFVVAVLLLASAASAQENVVDRKDIVVDQDAFRDVAGDLRCPTCTGLSILDSDAAFSVQIKNEVRVQLSQGKNKDDILRFFTERYGPWILRAPPTAGVHLWAWILPVAALIVGGLVIFMFVWRRKSAPSDATAVSQGRALSTDEAVAELHARLAKAREGTHV
jgi:cytochrome c-type biogenesis protein CcmH